MASTPSYLPVHSLSSMVTPTTSDYIVVQSAAENGDVGLLTIGTLIATFFQETIDAAEIDSTTIAKYEAMGWSAPT